MNMKSQPFSLVLSDLRLASWGEQHPVTIPAIRLALVFLQSARVDPGLTARTDQAGFMVHVPTRSHDLFGMVDWAGAGRANGCAVHGGVVW